VSVNAQTQYTYKLFSAPPSFGGIQAERINQYDNVVGTVIDNSGGEWGLIRYSDGGRKALMAQEPLTQIFMTAIMRVRS